MLRCLRGRRFCLVGEGGLRKFIGRCGILLLAGGDELKLCLKKQKEHCFTFTYTNKSKDTTNAKFAQTRQKSI